jgi:diguanylate cyclase (GGDEF)-like protein
MMKSKKNMETNLRVMEVMREANEKLSARANALEQRNRELEHLHELGILLQSCLTVEESHAVIAQTVRKLFFTESGAVYLFSSPLQTLVPVAAWGDDENMVSLGFIKGLPAAAWGNHRPMGNLLPQTAGWSLVQEQSYSDDGRYFPVLCPDGNQPGQNTCFCAPMVGQRETLGLLYIQLNGDMLARNADNRERAIKTKRQLAVTTAETIALFLKNIRLRENLYHQSIHDPLTGLMNRRSMYEFLEKEILRTTRKKQPMGVILIDIDHFKTINDTYGHGAGDAMLREFGLFSQKHIRGGDFACRYGGEEFLLILTEASLENVKERAEQLRKEARLLAVHYRSSVLDPITLSLGVAVYPENGRTAQELLLAADAALYQAKADGRDRIATVQKYPIAEYTQQL